MPTRRRFRHADAQPPLPPAAAHAERRRHFADVFAADAAPISDIELIFFAISRHIFVDATIFHFRLSRQIDYYSSPPADYAFASPLFAAAMNFHPIYCRHAHARRERAQRRNARAERARTRWRRCYIFYSIFTMPDPMPLRISAPAQRARNERIAGTRRSNAIAAPEP